MACAVLATAGCDQIAGRRKIQEGSALYNEGEYIRAAEAFEDGLKLAPGLSIGHHNAALANFRAWAPGMESEANRAFAKRAGEHFEAYLEAVPDDAEMVNLLTTLWIDSEQHDRALEYWGQQLRADPDNDEILQRLAGINNKIGRHDEGIKWLRRRIEIAPNDEAKAGVLLKLADVQRSRMTNSEIVDEERIEIADVGIEALQQAGKLDPDNPRIQSYLGTLYQMRAMTHGSSWAQAVDSASQRYHQIQFVKLRDQAAKTAAASAPSTAPGEK